MFGNKKEKDYATERRAHNEEEKNGIVAEILSWVKLFVTVIVVVLIITNFIIINARVPSGSMESTIMTRDRLIGFRFAYWFSEPNRGDIVLFDYPVNEKEIYIKRVIGESGDHIEIVDGQIFINGSEEPLYEPYLHEEWFRDNTGYVFDVPEGCYFVMGDNRNNSEDGRYWAEIALREGLASTEEEAVKYSFVTEDEVLGKAIFTYYKTPRLLK